MHTTALYLFLLVDILFGTTAGQPPPPLNDPTDVILLSCGGPPSAPSEDHRVWYGDAQSKFTSSNFKMSSATNATVQGSVYAVPYMTARISHSNFTYSFPVLPGSKFIRLYFYPATYSSGLDTSKSFFTVTANNYILLSNFSAYLNVHSLPQQQSSYIMKEFIVTVWDNQILNLTFSPSPSSFAFINGIEIVPIPNSLYTKGIDLLYGFPSFDTFFRLDNFTALETVYRLNVGGGDVKPVNDSAMFRKWADDSEYILEKAGFVHNSLGERIIYTEATPRYTAPEVVYNTIRSMGNESGVNMKYNLTWLFPIDSGFNYLVRLHFCDTDILVSHSADLLFYIFINNMTAEEADVYHWSGGNDIPVYRDYVVWVPKGTPSKQKLWLALHPDSNSQYKDANLNGLEIFKLNNSNGELSGLNPELFEDPVTPEQQHPKTEDMSKSKGSFVIAAIIGGVLTTILAFAFVVFFVYRKKGQEMYKHKSMSWHPFSSTTRSTARTALLLPTDLCCQFTMAKIRSATRNFNGENVIGNGGFGAVYKGFIKNGSIPVAIKRLSSLSRQGVYEFHTEIKMLSRLRHAHLVSLIGYCDEESEMILVYEFMPHGNLQDHLYKNQNTPLPWKQRLQICIGAARGLHYLHTGTKHTIIHRDVKSSNILLDSNWAAKVSDFGLSKTGPTRESQTHVSTVVKGTLGYLDPEYYKRQQLTEKSDVYSFGVVLLEALCGRPPMMPKQPQEQVNLVHWTRHCLQRRTIEQIIDPQLKGDIARVSLNKFLEIAESCVRDKPAERPTVGDVAWGLEFALQLQQTAEESGNDDFDLCETQKATSEQCKLVNTTDDDEPFTSSDVPMLYSMNTMSTDERSYSNNESDRVKPEDVFSEIMNKHGR